MTNEEMKKYVHANYPDETETLGMYVQMIEDGILTKQAAKQVASQMKKVASAYDTLTKEYETAYLENAAAFYHHLAHKLQEIYRYEFNEDEEDN